MSDDSNLRTHLVSVIVPCFNMEKYIARFLDSILEQTYTKIELILVNDGSTDGTRDIIKTYLPRLERVCEQVHVVDQKNKGLAGAVSTGLSRFSGEFLTWPDPDDWLEPDSLERRVALLRRYPEVGLVRSNAHLFGEQEDRIVGTIMKDARASEEPQQVDDLFEKLVFRKTFFAPVCHFVRSRDFLASNSSRSIYYTPKAPQNLQMLLPISQMYPALIDPIPTGSYCKRPDSRSQVIYSKSAKKLYDRYSVMLDILEHVLPELPHPNPAATHIVLEHNRRNMLLPVAFRGALDDECRSMLDRTSVSQMRKNAAKALISIRTGPAFGMLDTATAKIPSKILARLFGRLTRFPESECQWHSRKPIH
ncbi:MULTISPECIES: glycosyltransferase family A protein [Pseudomonadati]|uniref:glycosyltransferase family A protein n=1 Tax=Pseudomonadati TaxID=3379134 RepID=UPI0032640D08